MRQNKLVLGLLILGLTVGGLTSAWAHDGEKDGDAHHHEGHDMKDMHTTADILKMVDMHHKELAKTVADKKLSEVHEHAFAIRDAAKELPGTVSPEKKAKVESTVTNISKLADELDKSGDANNQVATEANLKKMDGLLMMLTSQVS